MQEEYKHQLHKRWRIRTQPLSVRIELPRSYHQSKRSLVPFKLLTKVRYIVDTNIDQFIFLQ